MFWSLGKLLTKIIINTTASVHGRPAADEVAMEPRRHCLAPPIDCWTMEAPAASPGDGCGSLWLPQKWPRRCRPSLGLAFFVSLCHCLTLPLCSSSLTCFPSLLSTTSSVNRERAPGCCWKLSKQPATELRNLAGGLPTEFIFQFK